jgi:hypothetical protein
VAVLEGQRVGVGEVLPEALPVDAREGEGGALALAVPCAVPDADSDPPAETTALSVDVAVWVVPLPPSPPPLRVGARDVDTVGEEEAENGRLPRAEAENDTVPQVLTEGEAVASLLWLLAVVLEGELVPPGRILSEAWVEEVAEGTREVLEDPSAREAVGVEVGAARDGVGEGELLGLPLKVPAASCPWRLFPVCVGEVEGVAPLTVEAVAAPEELDVPVEEELLAPVGVPGAVAEGVGRGVWEAVLGGEAEVVCVGEGDSVAYAVSVGVAGDEEEGVVLGVGESDVEGVAQAVPVAAAEGEAALAVGMGVCVPSPALVGESLEEIEAWVVLEGASAEPVA